MEIPETLGWDVDNPPGPAIGWLVLVFKILVILPVIRLGIGLWRKQTTPAI